MAVDLAKLSDDEETVRIVGSISSYPHASAFQNVLDALNLYRCRAKFAEQELTRVNAELIEVRNGAEHNRIFGRQ